MTFAIVISAAKQTVTLGLVSAEFESALAQCIVPSIERGKPTFVGVTGYTEMVRLATAMAAAARGLGYCWSATLNHVGVYENRERYHANSPYSDKRARLDARANDEKRLRAHVLVFVEVQGRKVCAMCFTELDPWMRQVSLRNVCSLALEPALNARVVNASPQIEMAIMRLRYIVHTSHMLDANVRDVVPQSVSALAEWYLSLSRDTQRALLSR